MKKILEQAAKHVEEAHKKPKKSGIHIKASHRGLLHEKLGVPEGETIPEGKIQAAKNSRSPKLRKEANFAENAKHFKKK